ncbi:MAG: type II secretion system F family protein [Pirellulales bacterium]
MNETELYIPGAFLGIALLVMVTGRWIFGIGKNKPEEMLSSSGTSLGGLTRGLAGVIPMSKAANDKIKSEVIKAGFYGRYAAADYLALRNAAIVAWMFFVGAAVVATVEQGEETTQRILLVGAGVLLLIWALPRVILGMQASSRVKRIHHALPDGLDMITMTMSAGMPLQKSIERVAKELHQSHRDLASELTILGGQTDAGSLEQGLKELAKRIDQPDVSALATLIRHAERLGGNITGAFHEFSDSIRQTRRQKAEEHGNRTSVKLSFPVIFFLAPPIYVLLLGPAVLELRQFVVKENAPGGVLNQSDAASQSTISPLSTEPDDAN